MSGCDYCLVLSAILKKGAGLLEDQILGTFTSILTDHETLKALDVFIKNLTENRHSTDRDIIIVHAALSEF